MKVQSENFFNASLFFLIFCRKPLKLKNGPRAINHLVWLVKKIMESSHSVLTTEAVRSMLWKLLYFKYKFIKMETNAMLHRKNSILKYKKNVLSMKTTFHSIELTASVHSSSRLLAVNQIPNSVLTYSEAWTVWKKRTNNQGLQFLVWGYWEWIKSFGKTVFLAF